MFSSSQQCTLSNIRPQTVQQQFNQAAAHHLLTHPVVCGVASDVSVSKGQESRNLMVMDMGQHIVQDYAMPLTLHQMMVPGLEDRARTFPHLSTARQLSPGTGIVAICSFSHPFIHPSIQSVIHPFIRSFIHPSTHLFICSFIRSFIHSFIRSFIWPKAQVLITLSASLKAADLAAGISIQHYKSNMMVSSTLRSLLGQHVPSHQVSLSPHGHIAFEASGASTVHSSVSHTTSCSLTE